MEERSKLAVLWTSADRDVALKMAFMYTKNAKKNGWFDDVKLIVWGPSSKLLAQDFEIQAHLKNMIELGVEVIACKSCSDSYGVSEALEDFGVNVFYAGEAFTEILKSDFKTITI
jgi:hypothetical protein